jgi:hypothetical protein
VIRMKRPSQHLEGYPSIADTLVIPKGRAGTCSDADPLGRGSQQSEIRSSTGHSQTEWQRSAELEATFLRSNEALGAVFLGPFSAAFGVLGPRLLLRSGNMGLRIIGMSLGLYDSSHGKIDEPAFWHYVNPPTRPASALGDYGDLAKDLELAREFMEHGRKTRAQDSDHWKEIDAAAEKRDHDRHRGKPDTEIA